MESDEKFDVKKCKKNRVKKYKKFKKKSKFCVKKITKIISKNLPASKNRLYFEASIFKKEKISKKFFRKTNNFRTIRIPKFSKKIVVQINVKIFGNKVVTFSCHQKNFRLISEHDFLKCKFYKKSEIPKKTSFF